MKIAGYEILKSQQVDELRNITNIIKSFSNTTERPSLAFRETWGTGGIRLPYIPIDKELIFDCNAYSDVLRTITISLREEIFREGIELEEKFVQKCAVCKKEFDHIEEDNICDECKSIGQWVEPDITQKQTWEKWSKDANENNQTLEEVLKMVEDDLNIIDNGYLLVAKSYIFDSLNHLIGYKVSEIVRVDPRHIDIIADKSGRPGRNDSGAFLFTCITHRHQIWIDKLTCPECGKPLFKAYFKSINAQNVATYYIKDEIIHVTKYSISLTYGFSPIVTVWQKVITLLEQDRTIKNYYTKGRPPGVLLFVRGVKESIEKAWQWMLSQFEQNPHMVAPIPIEDKTGKQMVQIVDFTKTLQEMQWIETREEFRRAVAAVFGVMPLFTGQSQGGIAQQGLEITVTNRAVMRGQIIHNRKLLPFIAEQLGITDYIPKIQSAEKMDEITELRIENQKIVNAQGMQSLGFDVEQNEEGEFEFTKKPTLPTPTAGISSIFPASQQQRFTGEPESVQRSIVKGIYNSLEQKSRSFALQDARLGKKDADYYSKFDWDNLNESIKIKLMNIGVTKEDLDRTEVQAQQNEFRERMYEKMEGSENFKYRWINPMDDRTTDICRAIVHRTDNGVTMEKLKEIVKQESRKEDFDLYKDKPFTPHFNCRSTFVRVL